MPDNSAQSQSSQSAKGSAQSAQTSSATASMQDRLKKFKIPFGVEQRYPELIELIILTESMNDDERQYWFQILPIMTTEQIEKLKQILLNEKQQLAQLDQRYAQELQDLDQKHASEWDEYKAKEKRDELQQKESSHESDEKQLEEELLKRLGDV